MNHWHILNREGIPMDQISLPKRPHDSTPEQGEAFRPWYKEDEHLHIENGYINGIHGFGTLEQVQARLKNYLANEDLILEKFGNTEDILLPTVDAFLKN